MEGTSVPLQTGLHLLRIHLPVQQWAFIGGWLCRLSGIGIGLNSFDLAGRGFGAGHHAAEGTGAGGGGLLAGLTGKQIGLVHVGHGHV